MKLSVIRGEEWRPVVGFDRYEVSNMGRVRSLFTRAPRMMVGRVTKWGYREITLTYAPKKTVHKLIGALVLRAFVGPRPTGLEVAHDNGKASDDRLSNLAYKTKIQNAADRERHGKTVRGAQNGGAILTVSEVRRIRKMPGECSAIAPLFGVSRSAIHSIKTRKSWTNIT